MTAKGSEFGKVQPIQNDALLRVSGKDPTKAIDLGVDPDTLENGEIVQVSPEGAFRPGQQIYFWLTVYNGPAAGGEAPFYISRVRLKPWWKRVTEEKRGPGDPVDLPAAQGWIDNDEKQFGSGPIAAPSANSPIRAQNNRLVWFPVPKILDVTQFQTPNPPPVAPARQSDSLFEDDVWTMDLQDPTGAAYAATKGLTQPRYGRSVCFRYVSHGYALGLTHQFDVFGSGEPHLLIDLTWITGAA